VELLDPVAPWPDPEAARRGRSFLVAEGGRARAATTAAPNGEAAVRPARGGLRPVAGDTPRGGDGPTVGAEAPHWALWLVGSLAAFGVWQPATRLLIGPAACLPTAELVTSGTWRVCSMSGGGGGRPSWIYKGWRWLVVWASVSVDYLGRTKCWGRIWLPVVEPDASLAVACGGW
jgi:hypothetical protein